MIGRRKAAGPTESDEAPEFWVAYSDLLVSLLMVFALLLFLALSNIQHEVETVQGIEGAINSAIAAAEETLQGTGTGIRVDSMTKAITLDAEVLFAYGSARLQPSAQQAVRDVATRFIPAVLSNPAVDTMLYEIVIEGHTDTVGSYMSNLLLSQERAYSVMRAMVESTYGEPYAPRLRRLLVASGRSEVHPVLTEGQPDARLSRRIEIHFRTRNDVLLKRIFEQTSTAGR